MASAQAQSMQTTLAATSHDLRTPVQSIMHASGILLAESSEEDRDGLDFEIGLGLELGSDLGLD